jgi:hypothetical protein
MCLCRRINKNDPLPSLPLLGEELYSLPLLKGRVGEGFVPVVLKV